MSEQKRAGFGQIEFGQDQLSLMTFVAQQVMNGIATATLVKVMAVRDGVVDVKPMVSQIDGKGTGSDHGTIHSLPWFALRAGPCEVRIKPRVGDIGCAVFCHNDISSVKANRKPSLPSSRRRYDWSDGLYFGGFLPAGEASTFIEIDADDNVQITAPTVKITGNVEITGDVTLTGNFEQTGDLHSSGTIAADTDVTADGKSGKSHTHGGIQTGSGTSGPPT